jgi:DNA adenine methylase
MKVFVPPLKCQGIKTKLVEWIHDSVKERLHQHSQQRWIEPYMGSGVVGFNIRPAVAIFADINPHIIAFYNAIKHGDITPQSVRAFLEQEGATLAKQGQAYYNAVRARFNDSPNSLDFLFLSRASFNGVMRFNRKGHYNVPFGHKPERFAKSYITKIANQVDYVAKACECYDWTFVCSDFRQTLCEATAHDLIYCDPPYMGRHVDYFDSWSECDEADLFKVLCATQAKFVLSTWSSTAFRANAALEKYRTRFHIHTREHFYHVGANEHNRNAVVEALVTNISPQQHSSTSPVMSAKSGTTSEQLVFFPV